MDKAPDYESGDSRFESWQGRFFLNFCTDQLCRDVGLVSFNVAKEPAILSPTLLPVHNNVAS